jgi:phosphoglycolate phosphatase-like HAD superfamily hydrolase
MPLYLFDVDGTLVRMGGAGSRAMARTFEALWGVRDAFSGLDFRGGLDPLLVSLAMERAGIKATRDRLETFKETFFPTLRREVNATEGEMGPCPGAAAALKRLAREGPLGLVTGNWREGARVKLSVFDLWRPFEVCEFMGAFGEDGASRGDLALVAMRRARARGFSDEPVIVLGDTPQDVAGARAAGAVAVALRTGWSEEAELREALPDLLLDDLTSGLEAILEIR